jgi:hemerythrin-like domain-containing protein
VDFRQSLSIFPQINAPPIALKRSSHLPYSPALAADAVDRKIDAPTAISYLPGGKIMRVKSVMQQATRAISSAFAPGDSEVESSDILDTLKREHDEVKDLLESLSDADKSVQRRALVQKIKSALVPHTKAEEKVVYDAVIALRDKEAQKDGHEGYLEHEWAAKTLQRLESIANAASPEHKAAAKVLKELVEHHIDEEERNVWKDVKEHFSKEDRKTMNAAFLAAKRRVKA